MHKWTVVFRNDKMGFVKTFHTQCSSYLAAAKNGEMQLSDRGYNPAEFAVIELKRGAAV